MKTKDEIVESMSVTMLKINDLNSAYNELLSMRSNSIANLIQILESTQSAIQSILSADVEVNEDNLDKVIAQFNESAEEATNILSHSVNTLMEIQVIK